MAISHMIPLAEHPTSSGAIRTLALSCDRHKGAERSQARHLAVDPGVWRDAPGDGWRDNGMVSMLVSPVFTQHPWRTRKGIHQEIAWGLGWEKKNWQRVTPPKAAAYIKTGRSLGFVDVHPHKYARYARFWSIHNWGSSNVTIFSGKGTGILVRFALR